MKILILDENQIEYDAGGYDVIFMKNGKWLSILIDNTTGTSGTFDFEDLGNVIFRMMKSK